MAMRGNPYLVQFTACKAAQFAVGTGAAALASTPVSQENVGVGLVYLQADPANTGTVRLGDSGGQFVALAAGDWFPAPLPIANLNQLHAVASAAGQVLNALIVY